MAETREIHIPQIKLEQMVVTIEGKTPLITHRFGELARKEIEEKQQKKAKAAKEARDPEAEFRDALYIIDEKEERYGFPSAGIKKALVYGGYRFTNEKSTTILKGSINILGDLLEIKGSKPKMRADTVRLAGGKVSSIAYRPMFWPWEIEVPTIYNATMLTAEQVINLFQIAGFAVGIGDWRPEKNGNFGQFTIKEVKM